MNKLTNQSVKSALLILLLVVLALGSAWAFWGHTFQTLNNEALDSAQIARHVSQGHSVSTNVIPAPGTPTLATPPKSKYYPEMKRAPLFPMALAGAFGVGGLKDGTITVFTTLLFVVSVIALFVLAQRLLKSLPLALATAIAYVLSVPVLSVASAGQPQALGACLLLALLLVLTPKNETYETTGPVLEEGGRLARAERVGFKGNNLLVVGILAGLCFLNDYCSLFYVLPLLVLWPGQARKWNLISALTCLAGFLLVAAPWWIRNARIASEPFYSAEWLIYDQGGVKALSKNLGLGLSGFIYNAVTVPHLFLTPFILISLWIRPAADSLARRKAGILLSLVCALLGYAAFGRTGAMELVPLAGLLTLVGITTFHQLVSYSWGANLVSKKIAAPLRFEPVPGNANVLKPMATKALKGWQFHQMKLNAMSMLRIPMTLRRSDDEEQLYAGKWPLKTAFEARAVGILLLVLVLPFLQQVVLTPKAKVADLKSALQPLDKVVSKDSTIVTDIPQAVAWYADRKAMLLPPKARDFMEIKESGIGALYLADFNLGERLPEWRAAYSRTAIPGFENVPLARPREVLYVKKPSPTDARRLVKNRPQSGEPLVVLGQALLEQKDFQGALTAFRKAQSLQPPLPEAFIGGGEASFNLKDIAGAKKQLLRGLQLAPRSRVGLTLLALVAQIEKQPVQAIGYYERILADAPFDFLSLNNLASLYEAQDGNLYRALEMARRAAAQDPNNGSVIDTLGWTCYRLGYKKEALEYLKQAVKLSPDNATIQEHLKRASA
jgi:tetratricopeptide (TPR) repeat protein